MVAFLSGLGDSSQMRGSLTTHPLGRRGKGADLAGQGRVAQDLTGVAAEGEHVQRPPVGGDGRVAPRLDHAVTPALPADSAAATATARHRRRETRCHARAGEEQSLAEGVFSEMACHEIMIGNARLTIGQVFRSRRLEWACRSSSRSGNSSTATEAAAALCGDASMRLTRPKSGRPGGVIFPMRSLWRWASRLM